VGDKAFAYDRSKAEGERIVLSAAARGLDAVVLSPTAIIGPSDPEPGLMGQAFLQICRREIPALVPGGYDMVDVRDIADAAIAAIEKGRKGEKYLLSGKWHSILEVSKILKEITGIRTVSNEMPFWVADAGLPFITLYSRITGNNPLYTSESLSILRSAHRNISHAKATNEFGFNPRDIRESLIDLIKWFTENNYLKINK
jgi:dihydroflavonol-4-reductase